jgi:elongation factor G
LTPCTNPKFIGTVIGALNQRRGTIIDTEVRDDEFTLTAEVALNDMFGYSSQLRGMTQGKGRLNSSARARPKPPIYYVPPAGEFTMEYKMHAPVLPNIQKDMVEAYRKKQLGK